MADGKRLEKIGELPDGRILWFDRERELFTTQEVGAAAHVVAHIVEEGPETRSAVSTQGLLGTTDPRAWATAFLEQFADAIALLRQARYERIDDGTMIGWFANAMQSKETAVMGPGTHRLSTEELHELVFQAGGVGSVCVMALAPSVVMPSQEIIEGLNRLLSEKGLPASSGAGASLEEEIAELRLRPTLEFAEGIARLGGTEGLTININLNPPSR